MQKKHLFYLKKYLIWDNAAKRNIKKGDTGHTGLFWYWAAFGCSCCTRDLTVLFVPFLGLLQIILQIFFASFVPKLHFYQKAKGSW